MIDVNAITELLIQHSQSTGFDKSLEMLTQTLRQLTDTNASTATASSPSQQLAQTNPFENLLIKRLPTSIPTSGLTPPNVSQVWYNPAASSTFTHSLPPFFPRPLTSQSSSSQSTSASSTAQRSLSTSIDFHSQQQYQNEQN
jgi:hypothetical protein